MSNGTDTAPLIGTHSGHFHADEALAVFLLRLLPDYRHATLVRTRDPDTLATCTIVVDVGGVHDDALRRYDHHQRDFAATFPAHATKLSSAGLVWLHYGHRIIAAATDLPADSPDCALLYEKIYTDFVEPFDANDNGIPEYDATALRKADIPSRFNNKGFTLAAVVNRYNYAPSASDGAAGPTANGPTTSGAPASKPQDGEDMRFLRASAFIGEQFTLELHDRARAWLPARAVVQEAFAARTQHHPEGRVIVIPYRAGGVPWADHLHAIEAASQTGPENQVWYALFAESEKPDSKWRIRAVSLEPGSFENRKGLPESWRGVRDEELSGVCGVAGAVFVHASGFIGGNTTFEGALEMAGRAVEM
ncbi:hypothetical protein LTR53_016244 [Teratosphaeriaceae sp. CCFEE 6253]|nr:hypothetical protein LTR53_016244 [Teratosphaeriaceae sp. CCFEE 6253]